MPIKPPVLFWAAILLLGAAAPTIAQAPNPGSHSAAQYELHVRRGVMVTMRDGTRLAADLYLPNTVNKVPAILMITSYGRSSWDFKGEEARWFAQRGYAFIEVDSRGRFDSGGDQDPFGSKQKTDGYDLVEWLAGQAWSTGKVGMWGPSYMGFTCWWTASTVPPHLAAIVPLNTPGDAFDDHPYRQGALMGNYVPDWVSRESGRTPQIVGDGPYGRPLGQRLEDYSHTPYSEINAYRGMENAPWLINWYQQNKSTDPYWKAIAYQDQEHYSRINVPSLSVTGWFDVNHAGSPANYLGMKRFGATPEARRPSLIIGPWTHYEFGSTSGGINYGPAATFDVDGYALRWFDHFLKGLNNGVEKDPPVYVFVMGEDKWRAEQDWPPPEAKPTKFYFDSRGHASSQKGDGVLTMVPPRRAVSDVYVYDPHRPTLDPSTSFPNSNGHIDGAWDTRQAADGDEVLVYQTQPLSSPVEVIGPIEATIYASTSARDTDWMVRLVDVQPDGRALLLADGVLRARNRDPANDGQFNAARLTVIEPEKVYLYTIRFWRGTANQFQPGHRIRVEISSSWYPFYLPNLNSGVDNLADVSISNAVVARQAIHHGPTDLSYLLLPIVPAESSIPR